VRRAWTHQAIEEDDGVGPGQLRCPAVNAWQQAALLVAGGLISGLAGIGAGEYRRWRDRLDARRDRQREALLELNGPLLRLLVELSRQLEQGPDAARGQWVNGVRDIGAAGTWIFDPTEVANRLDWEPARMVAQEVERAWSDRLRLSVYDPAILTKVEEVRRLARAYAFLGADIRITATQLRDAVGELLAAIRAELDRP
jgi:hypothetical protein